MPQERKRQFGTSQSRRRRSRTHVLVRFLLLDLLPNDVLPFHQETPERRQLACSSAMAAPFRTTTSSSLLGENIISMLPACSSFHYDYEQVRMHHLCLRAICHGNSCILLSWQRAGVGVAAEMAGFLW